MYKGSDDHYMVFHKTQTNAIKREKQLKEFIFYTWHSIIYIPPLVYLKTLLYRNIH